MSNIKLFESKHIRSLWDDKAQRWFFAVVDVIAVLTESQNPQVYWRVLKKRLLAEGNETVTNCNGLKMTAADRKQRITDVADAQQLLRLIQSIPSPKAEPFKLWLARVGYERLEEIENPELAARRMGELYKAKGYSDEWIARRVRGIAIRDELTNEWQKRGVKEQREYAILTAEISRATFGMTPSEYKAFKSLAKPADNLRDHMTDLESSPCRAKPPPLRSLATKMHRDITITSMQPLKGVPLLGVRDSIWRKNRGNGSPARITSKNSRRP